MSNFNIEQLKNSLLAAVDGKTGHEMSPLLIFSMLMKEGEVQEFLKEKGIDSDKLTAMFTMELNGKYEVAQRREKHISENATAETFEISQHDDNRTHSRKEDVYEFILGLKLAERANGGKMTAVDVLEQVVSNPDMITAKNFGPTQALAMVMSKSKNMEYMGIKTLQKLDIKPSDLFPTLKEKLQAHKQEMIGQAADSVGSFVTQLIAAVEKEHPGLIAGMMSGQNSSHPRVK